MESYNGTDRGGDSGADGGDAPAPRDDTFFMPPSFPKADQYKPGDTITLSVVGKDKDGQLEVECQHDDSGQRGGDGADWKSDLRKSVPMEGGM